MAKAGLQGYVADASMHACLISLLLVAATAAFAEDDLDRPLIPARATVVLLPSLAGDVESERTSRGQLKMLTEIVGKSEAEKLVVFWEGGEPDPAHIKTLHIKPSRADFLTAAGQLAGSTNPLVVVAWGHGGTQGQMPVFHLRGPRLTAADFKDFAQRATSGPSTWILMFRGSGRFANALASADRLIISSEGEAIFRNDPIAMDVLVKLWRAQPAATVRAITDGLGPAIAKWYDDQNLARTEEPMLWFGTAPARPLIPPAQPLEKETNTN